MNTIILKEPGKLETFFLSNDKTLNADEVLLKVHRIGICGTDLHAFLGNQPFFTYPRILGHELGVEFSKWVRTLQMLRLVINVL